MNRQCDSLECYIYRTTSSLLKCSCRVEIILQYMQCLDLLSYIMWTLSLSANIENELKVGYQLIKIGYSM